MTYQVAYDPALGNALVGVKDSSMPIIEGIEYVMFEGDMPDMAKWFWNTSTLSWNAKYLESVSKREFLKRFTADEYAGIKTAAGVSAQVDYYWQQFLLAEEVVMSDPNTRAGIVPADIRYVNAIPITGVGTEASPWRPS